MYGACINVFALFTFTQFLKKIPAWARQFFDTFLLVYGLLVCLFLLPINIFLNSAYWFSFFAYLNFFNI